MLRNIFYLFLCFGFLQSCTISPTAKQYAVESDAINGVMQVHEGPGMKDMLNIIDACTYYDKVDSYFFSSAEDEANSPITIRFGNNNTGHLSGSTDYRLPTGSQKHLMMDIEETYGSPEAVEQNLVRQSIEKAAFNAGQFMNIFDALGKNRSYLQEIIFDQANNGQYQVTFKESKIIDVATGKEKVIKVSDRIACTSTGDSTSLCIAGYLRTEQSALDLYGIELFNFTVKGLDPSESVKGAISSQLARSNKMEELAIQAREAQVNTATTIETSKAEVAVKEAETAIAVAEAQKQTAIKAEQVKQAKLDAEATLAAGRAQADIAKLKNVAGITPLEKAQINSATMIGVAEALAKRPQPSIVTGGSGSTTLEEAATMKELVLIMNSLNKNND